MPTKKVWRANQSFFYADKSGKKLVSVGDLCPASVVKGRESLFDAVAPNTSQGAAPPAEPVEGE